MAATDASAEEVGLPPGWGRAWLVGRGVDTRLPHSRDGRGRVLVWRPDGGGRHACDLEASEAGLSPAADLLHATAADFPARWVCSEVEAKIYQVPILAWVRGQGLAPCPASGMTVPLRSAGGDGARGEILYLHFPAIGGHLAFGRLSSPGVGGA